MNFTDYINDKDAFTQSVKDALAQKAFSELEELKKEMAMDFLKQQENNE
jgi:hypothetical protein